MNHSESVRLARRRQAAILVFLLGVIAVVAVAFGVPSLAASPRPISQAAHPPSLARGGHQPAGVADGTVPGGVTIFSTDVPAVTKLDPELLSAMRRAATDAGIPFYVNSGWRSKMYQEQLLDQAIRTYGSRAEAARWVATPTTSPHVSGHAVDIGRADADSWLSAHGAAYGLCQIYRNEIWHYELRPQAATSGCPTMYDDPTHDPRMR